MKHPFLRWLALLFSLLTATSYATHLKGGTLSWEPVSSTSTTFTVRAKIQLNYDLSDTGITGATGPLVKGKRVYVEGDIVAVNVGSTKLYWGDEDPNATPPRYPVELEGPTSSFTVVKVDEASQIITVEPNALVHEYTGSEGDLFTLNLRASVRDNEEVVNRGGIMRLESTVKLQLGASQPNRPPVFDFKEKELPAVTIPLPVVIAKSGTASFEVPVAVDPDNAATATDVITYRFVDEESEATQDSQEESPWEEQDQDEAPHPSIAYDPGTGKWKITWDTSGINQTIKTYAFQVVAEDRPINDPTGPAKSKATIEFQVWVNDPAQNGIPTIALLPDFTSFTAVAGTPMEFRILGSDRNSAGDLENSRLVVVTGAGEMPAGAVITPAGGFVGENGGPHGDHMEGVFSWTPQAADVGTQKILNLQIEDDDGNRSAVKTVTINVAGGSGPEPLELTVTPSTVEGDYLRVTVLPDAPMSLTVAATCATSGVPLQLYTEDEMPGNAVMTPALPVAGSSTAQSTFTWTPGASDITPLTNPHEVTFIAGDAHGREVVKTLRIYVLPALPTITLAPGEPTSVSSEPWKAVSFDFIATGGYGSNPSLDLEVLGVGSLDSTTVNSGAQSTFKWRVLPGVAASGVLRVQVEDSLGQTATLEVPYTITYPAAAAAAPQWWVDRNVVSGGPASDFGMANQGQLKAITKAAYEAIKAEYTDLDTATTAGANLANFVNGFSLSSGNYAPVTQGQVKNAANLVYRAIEAVTGKQGIGVPWTDTADDDQSYAPAAVGQIKSLFSFPTPIGGLFNDPPEVAITSPASGSIFNTRNTVTFTATANDPDGIESVKFYVGENLIATDTTSPYSFSSGFSNGNFLIKAEATDNRGAVSQSSISIRVDQWINTAPEVFITSPTANQNFVSPAYFTITADATDADSTDANHRNNVNRVTIYLDNVVLGDFYSYAGPGPYSVSLPQMIVATGSHEIKVTAMDVDWSVSTTTATFNVIKPASGPMTIVLQDGLKGYLGTTDTVMWADSPTSKGSSSQLVLDNSPESSALVRWDTSLIPANATVTGVSLGFHVVPDGETLRDFTIYKMVRDWSEADVDWTHATATQNWGTAGAKNITTPPNQDREDTNLGTLSGAGDDVPISAILPNNGQAMKAVVQQWINTPSANKGIAIQHRAASVAVHPLILHPSEETTVSKRPKLTITYTLP